MINKSLLVLFFLVLSVPSFAANYWVSPTGTKTDPAECTSASPLSGADACAFATASQVTTVNNALAEGDTLYFRGGSYSITPTNYTGVIQPNVTGTSGARITYSAYSTETPVLVNASPNSPCCTGVIYRRGIVLTSMNYIKITGLTFEDWESWGLATNSSYNEITKCEFYNTTTYLNNGGSSFGLFLSGTSGGSIHNWIHDNTFHDLAINSSGYEGSYEGGDLLKIGDAAEGNYNSNYNTIENNIFYHAGHTCTENFGQYNVWRSNTAHNNGFKTDITHITGTATGGSSSTLEDTGKNFTDLGVRTNGLLYVHAPEQDGTFGKKVALITSISEDGHTLNYTAAASAPVFSAGAAYDISNLYFVDAANGGQGKYSHRAFHIDTWSYPYPPVGRKGTPYRDYQLFEGNRSGHASTNPSNNGADGLSLSASYCIVRYNDFYNSAGPGIHFKNTGTSWYNAVYNNTLYKNGLFAGYNHPVAPIVLSAINVASNQYNSLKNNLFYGNNATSSGVNNVFSAGTNFTWANNWCPDTGANGIALDCVGSADPKFANTDVTAYTTFTLPDLSVASDSTVINQGGALTTVHASDTGSGTDLYVTDSMYFQDGTWGSDLTRTAGTMRADWICVGTVDNCIQISTVSYEAEGEGDYTGAFKIVLTSGITRSDGNSIWLYKKSDGVRVLYGDAPDIGAHEYEGVSSDSGIVGAVISGAVVK